MHSVGGVLKRSKLEITREVVISKDKGKKWQCATTVLATWKITRLYVVFVL
jgi:hypothetical protein